MSSLSFLRLHNVQQLFKFNKSLQNVGQIKSFCDDVRRGLEKGLNQVMLMGRCGTDAQLRGTQNNPVVIFSLATHNNYKITNSDNFGQKTDWHRISVFKPRLQQKALDFAKKGSRLYVQGRLSYGEIIDSNGSSHQTTSVIADDIIFLSTSRISAEESADEIAS